MASAFSRFRVASMIAAGAALLLTGQAFGTVKYQILDLGTLGGTVSQGNAVNAIGQVAGSSTLANGLTHAIRTGPDQAIDSSSDLGTLGGSSSWGQGINTAGQVVGYSYLTDTGLKQAFRTGPDGAINTSSNLGDLGGGEATASGINSAGQVVGQSAINSTTSHAFRTAPNGAITAASDLGALDVGLGDAGYSGARAINDSGEVVGFSAVGYYTDHGFRTTATGDITASSDLGTLGGPNSDAYAINASGQVVGSSDVSATILWHAFRTAPEASIAPDDDLGTLGGQSYAYGINDAGQVVGTSYLQAAVGLPHAFFCDVSGSMQDLNDLVPANSGWTLAVAWSINNAGQIAGNGVIDNQAHAFLLTPVPEPASLAIFVTIGAIVTMRRRRPQISAFALN